MGSGTTPWCSNVPFGFLWSASKDVRYACSTSKAWWSGVGSPFSAMSQVDVLVDNSVFPPDHQWICRKRDHSSLPLTWRGRALTPISSP
eukprot:scaffold1019_cov338-Pavlova_lutheri.AAC.1